MADELALRGRQRDAVEGGDGAGAAAEDLGDAVDERRRSAPGASGVRGAPIRAARLEHGQSSQPADLRLRRRLRGSR